MLLVWPFFFENLLLTNIATENIPDCPNLIQIFGFTFALWPTCFFMKVCAKKFNEYVPCLQGPEVLGVEELNQPGEYLGLYHTAPIVIYNSINQSICQGGI